MQTLLSGDRYRALLGLLAAARKLDGDIVEMGVYRGGMLEGMATACAEKRCFGFDTFAGQPAALWQGDYHRPGEFGDTDFECVKAAMPSNVTLCRGVFPESAVDCGVERVCFAHVDFDLEQSTQAAIEWLIPRMTSRGVIVFDDWHWPHCEGVDRAIARAGLQVIDSAPYQCYWIAP